MQSRISSYSVFSSKTLPEFQEQDPNKILFPNINVLDDVVLKKTEKNELAYQTFFSNKVLEQVSPHFPLLYNNTPYVMMMEKFDGDFCEEENKFESVDEYMSFFLQIIMALYTIDSYGKFHGDLNPGNTLFKRIKDEDDEKGGYLKYVIEGETYYIKHYNRLWAVSDFEYTGEKGEVLETSGKKGFDKDFFNKLFREHINDINTNEIKGSWLYDMYTITRFTEFHKITDRVFQLMKEGKEYSLNPIKASPLLIKNDISHIFIRGESA